MSKDIIGYNRRPPNRKNGSRWRKGARILILDFFTVKCYRAMTSLGGHLGWGEGRRHVIDVGFIGTGIPRQKETHN